SYSANPNVSPAPGLQDHARVVLNWGAPQTCKLSSEPLVGSDGGLAIPVGAAIDYSTGARRVRGAMELTGIVANVRDTPTSGWRPVHSWSFQYDTNKENCNQGVSARRQLTQIAEQGSILQNGVTTSTDGPTVTLTYGDDLSWQSNRQVSSPALPRVTMNW